MSEVRDPAIKLFGKTIQLLIPDEPVLCKASSTATTPEKNELQSSSFTPISQDCKKPSEELFTAKSAEESSIDPSTSSGINEDPKTPTADKETSSSTNTARKEDPSNSEEKPPKPDKILPCPRCNSIDTKFCYYNNYNVNQPRHFCKNCQRYWTAGGTMRNTPVGSGRRKNKTSSNASHYRHIIVSEALQVAQAEGQSILSFGPDVPLCESMASALNLADKSQNSVQRTQEQKSGGDDSLSTTTVSNDAGLKNFQGYNPLQVPCFPAPPWPYPWNPAQYRPPPIYGPSGFPVSFYPTPQYWGCTVQPPPRPWTMPWLTPQSSCPDQFALPSSPRSPLGKHTRDGNLLASSKSEEKDSERGVLIPKTLRINDPNEAAKSSLWSTLGIKNDSSNSISGGSLFKAFQPKVIIEKNHVPEKSLVLQANPAALSRSLNFQESS